MKYTKEQKKAFKLNLSNQSETEKAKLREELWKKVQKIYPNLKTIHSKEYKLYKDKFNAGDKSIVPEFMEKILYHICKIACSVYANFDMEFLSFEDVLSDSYSIMADYLTKTTSKLPETKQEFVSDFLSGIIFTRTKREFQKTKIRNAHLSIKNCESYDKDLIEEVFDVGDVYDKIEKENLIKIINDCLQKMSGSERTIFHFIYNRGYSESKVADIMCLPRSNVSYYKNKIKNVIEKAINKHLKCGVETQEEMLENELV